MSSSFSTASFSNTAFSATSTGARLLAQSGDAPSYVDSDLYKTVIGLGVHSPSWVQSFFSLFTNYGLLIYLGLFVLVWWRARSKNDSSVMALAILAPFVTGLAYVVSEVVKSFFHEDRPCRGLVQTALVQSCPAPGDWSFPSNHSTIAAAATIGLIFAWRKLAPWVVSIALLMGFSRVFVGAHYPHDVVVGLLLGTVVAFLAVRFLRGFAEFVVRKLSGIPLLGSVFSSAPPAEKAVEKATEKDTESSDSLSSLDSLESEQDLGEESEDPAIGEPVSVAGDDAVIDDDAPTCILPRQPESPQRSQGQLNHQLELDRLATAETTQFAAQRPFSSQQMSPPQMPSRRNSPGYPSLPPRHVRPVGRPQARLSPLRENMPPPENIQWPGEER